MIRAGEAQLVRSIAEGRCWCGADPRGQVDTAAGVPSHFCRQCSPDHCELGRYLRARREGA